MGQRLGTQKQPPAAEWIDQAGVCIPPGLRVSFQRYLRPRSGVIAHPWPSSLGVLPVGLGYGGDLVIPLDDHEAFWIGLDLAPGAMPITLSTTVELRSGEIRSCRLVRVTSA